MRQYRPSDLNEVTDAAWDAVMPAFLSSVPFALGLAWALTAYLDADFNHTSTGIWPWVGFTAGVIIAAPFWWRWVKAIRTCKEFTRQMKQQS